MLDIPRIPMVSFLKSRTLSFWAKSWSILCNKNIVYLHKMVRLSTNKYLIWMCQKIESSKIRPILHTMFYVHIFSCFCILGFFLDTKKLEICFHEYEIGLVLHFKKKHANTETWKLKKLMQNHEKMSPTSIVCGLWSNGY